MSACTYRRAGAQGLSAAVLAFALACGALSLQGCGGGGGSSPSNASSSGPGGGGGTSYTVGGSISGLTGTGLVLQDNGGDNLSVAANATSFTFGTPVSSGQAYAVTVATQPSNPVETCTVSGGSGTASAAVNSVAVSCAAAGNVATITLDDFPVNGQPSSGGNTAYVTVRICAPGSSSNCQNIDHITVDTGSFGLRILSSVINPSLLAALPNVNGASPPYLAECQQFGSGYTWGSVRSVDFSVPTTSESVKGLPVQIIGDMEPAPSPCKSQAVTNGQMLGNSGYLSAAAFGANGLIGVGPFPQDCGQCAFTAEPSSNGTNYLVYTSCTSMSSSSCSPATAAANLQVINPVADFAVDNTGVIIQLPAVSATGVASVSGTMTFGIVAGTTGNNALGSATVYLADPSTGYVRTVYKGTTDTHSYIDSGSNGLYFNDASLTPCTGQATGFYCPGGANAPYNGPTSVAESATFEDYSGQHATTIDFTVENENLTDVVAAGLAGTGTANEFDWGIPFFFNRTVYTALGYRPDGTPITIGTYAAPFYAF